MGWKSGKGAQSLGDLRCKSEILELFITVITFKCVSCGYEREGGIETFTVGPPHTYTIVLTAQIESGFVAEDDLIPFSYSFELDTIPNEADGKGVSMVVYIMGVTIATVLHPGALRWYRLTQSPVEKVLPVYGE
ncbi:hypothetical protein TNCV_2189701 [Trichonephila clavipes]|nr:hypothetical protein TNCV_2189701 [Trichonephila clavipes]